MKTKIFKKIFSKRNILIMINIIFFIFISVCCGLYIDNGYDWIRGEPIVDMLLAIFKFLLIQYAFTALSLIVYYLAIMAGALNSKYKEEVEENKEDKK